MLTDYLQSTVIIKLVSMALVTLSVFVLAALIERFISIKLMRRRYSIAIKMLDSPEIGLDQIYDRFKNMKSDLISKIFLAGIEEIKLSRDINNNSINRALLRMNNVVESAQSSLYAKTTLLSFTANPACPEVDTMPANAYVSCRGPGGHEQVRQVRASHR